MATIHKNLSDFNKESIPEASDLRIAIVTSKWNSDITGNLKQGALETLTDIGVPQDSIREFDVPGTYELSIGAQMILEHRRYDAVISIGSVIRGETAHFDFVCQSVAQGIKDVSLKYNTPVIFCVLTDDTIEQSKARSGGAHGNKGVEAAVAAVEMAIMKNSLK